MRHVHDLGGRPDDGPIDRSEHEYSMWEKRTDAMFRLLAARGLIRVDEHRRTIESLEPTTYKALTYYERWIAAIESLLVEKGILAREEIDRKVRELDARESDE